MRVRVAALLLLALPAWAQAPSELRSRADLTLESKEALHRFTVPAEAYRHARRDLGDLRVLNGKDELVPFAFAGEAERAREAPAVVALPQFAVYAPGRDLRPESVDVTVRAEANGTLVSVQRRDAKAPVTKPVAWIVDASALPQPMQALIVEWEGGPGTEVVHARVEASEDLRSWSPVASLSALVRLEQAGRTISQPRIEFSPRKPRYLRITGDGPAFQLTSVKGELTSMPAAVKRTLRRVPATAGEKPGEYLVDLGGRLPVESVNVIFADNNSVAAAEIVSRDAPDGQWVSAGGANFYRLTLGGREVTAPALDIGRRPDRYWLIRTDPRGGGIGKALPSLEVAWRPAQVVFVARGDPVFHVAFGRGGAIGTSLPVEQLMPGYKRYAEYALPEAQVGAVTTSEPTTFERVTEKLGVTDGKKVGLWAVLLIGVGLLGFMAWRLMGQMKAPPTGKNG